MFGWCFAVVQGPCWPPLIATGNQVELMVPELEEQKDDSELDWVKVSNVYSRWM